MIDGGGERTSSLLVREQQQLSAALTLTLTHLNPRPCKARPEHRRRERLLLVRARTQRRAEVAGAASSELLGVRRRKSVILGVFAQGKKGEGSGAPIGAACRRRSGAERAAPASVSGGVFKSSSLMIRANLKSLDIDERLF